MAAVLDAFSRHGIKQMHAYRMWRHLIRYPSSHWDEVPSLPVAAKQLLDASFTRFTSRVLLCQTSCDGETTKLLIQLHDGQQLEAVIMTYDTTAPVAQDCARTAAASTVDSKNSDDDDDDFHSCASSDGRFTENDSDLESVGDADETGQGVAAPLVRSYISDDRDSRQRSQRRRAGMRGQLRATLCVSSQIGCQMGCTFCATGTMGLRGDLTAGEILEQLAHARSMAQIRNVVFMGMGEPLANYDAVKAAVRAMTDQRVFGLGRRQVTISTVGVIPRIKQLAADLPGVSLALSLHAPNQALRATIVPSARAHPLDRLMAAVRGYEQDSGRRVFMEYVLLAGVNDGPEHAHELGGLLAGHNATLNLIPWNPVHAAAEAGGGRPAAPMRFAAPSPDRVAAFQAIMKSQYGVPTTVRQEKGQDISGACGQLAVMHQDVQQAQRVHSGATCGQGEQPVAPGPPVAALRDIEDCLLRA